MAETVAARYWCHLCRRTVNPLTEIEIQCPNCNSGFIEQLEETPTNALSDLNPNQDLNLWAPILLGMINNGMRRRRPFNREEAASEEDYDLISQFRRRQRASAILEVLNDIQDRMRSGSPNSSSNNSLSLIERPRNREPHILLINSPGNGLSIGDDFYMTSGLEQLIQQLGENENSRHGTPPADKKAVEAMPRVKIESEGINCSICLEEFGVGEEGREMPCKHMFHDGCILPWLDMHSSCPVCRFQMPVEEREGEKEGANEGGNGGNGDDNGGGNGDNGRRFWPVPWLLNGLFSVSSSSSSSSSTNGVDGSGNVNGDGNGDPSNSHSDVN